MIQPASCIFHTKTCISTQTRGEVGVCDALPRVLALMMCVIAMRRPYSTLQNHGNMAFKRLLICPDKHFMSHKVPFVSVLSASFNT